MQIHADKRAAILKFYTRKTADRKRAIFRRIPARRETTEFLKKTNFTPTYRPYMSFHPGYQCNKTGLIGVGNC